jgi:hypothetical protein
MGEVPVPFCRGYGCEKSLSINTRDNPIDVTCTKQPPRHPYWKPQSARYFRCDVVNSYWGSLLAEYGNRGTKTSEG